MTGNGGSVFDGSRILRLDKSIEAVEIDFSIPRTIRIIPVHSKRPIQVYILKITPKGGAILV